MIALAVALCVPGLDTSVHASQRDFVELPQAFAQNCSLTHSRVPPVLETGRVRPDAFYLATVDQVTDGWQAQGILNSDACENVSLVLVPGQRKARISDRLTTRFVGGSRATAAPAAAGGRDKLTAGSGESPADSVPASAANLFLALGWNDGTRLAASSTANDAAKTDGKTGDTADDGDARNDGDADDQGKGDPKHEFTGSSSQAEPDLNSTEEQDLIQNGWK